MPDIALRLVAESDAEALSELVTRNREHLLIGGPARSDAWCSVSGQRAQIAQQLIEHDAGRTLPMLITSGGEVVGTMTLNEILRGPAQWASLGYWVDERWTGRGVATRAVALMLETAFTALSLHRIHAGVGVDNPASAAVLARNGFREYGFSPQMLRLGSAGGGWQDCRLFEIRADEHPAGSSPPTGGAALPRIATPD